MPQFICKFEDLTEPGCLGFTCQVNGQEIDGFVVRWRGKIRAYYNACPHTGVTLNWAEDQFFDLEQKYLQCSLHGALFQPLDGLCIYGPCNGELLTSLGVTLADGEVVLSKD